MVRNVRSRTRLTGFFSFLPFLLFLGCVLALATGARAEDSLVEELLEKMAATRVEPQRASFARQILSLGPSAPVQSFCEGYLLLLAGDDAGATLKLEAALARKKHFGQAPYMYGDAYSARGQQARAIGAYRRALAVEPELLPSRLALGRLLLECAEQQASPDSAAALQREAIEVVQRGIKDHPREMSLHVALGDSYVAMGRPAEAISPYLVADELEPANAGVESKLGFLYADRGELKLAQSYLAAALRDDPNNPAAVRRLADLYGREGKIAAALTLLSQGWRPVRDPNEQATIRRTIGFGLLAFGERIKAREHLEQSQLLQDDEENARALAWLDSSKAPTDPQGLALARKVLPAWNFRWLDEERMKTDTCWPPPEVAPRLIRAAEPVYPLEARKRGDEGEALVRGLISPEGRLIDVKIAESSGFPNLDAAALSAMRQSEVAPAVSSGAPVACWIEVPFRFSLHGRKGRLRDGGLPSTPGSGDQHIPEPPVAPPPPNIGK